MSSLYVERVRCRGVLAPIMLLGGIVLLAPTRAAAHFKLTDPTAPPQPATVQSWMSQDAVGGPQKNGPCGAVPNTALGDSPGTPVPNSVTVVQAGQKVTVPVTITVGHPGWFRIALFQGPSSGQTLTTLPDPKAQTGTTCTPVIMTNPVWSQTQPVLADGLPAGSTASTLQSGTKTFQVTIPASASCSTAQPCTLQAIMVMTDHPAADCYYHHCADIAIGSGATGGTTGTGGSSAGTGGATSTGGVTGTGGVTATGGSIGTGGAGTGGIHGTGGSTGAGGTGAGPTGGSGGSSVSTGTGGTSGGAGTSGGTTTGAGGSAGVGPGTVPPSTSSGCGCTIAGPERPFWAFGAAAALALVIARRRRR
jgi:MYXO-CTERM domain-containing protein